MNEFKLSYFLTKNKKIDIKSFKKQIRIGLLSSFTINGLAEILRVKCAEKNIGSVMYTANYNQYNQEIFDKKSNLYKFKPDISFLILDTRSLLGNLFFEPYSNTYDRKKFIEEKLNEMKKLVQHFISNSNSKLIVTNFSIPTYSPYGIFENKLSYGLIEMVTDLNNKIIEAFRNNPSVYVYDFNNFVHKFGENNVFDYRQYFFGDIKVSINYLSYLAHDFLGYVLPIIGHNRKCIVLDLDNTLWGGIIGEDGFNEIQLGDSPTGRAFIEFQCYLKALQKRGIILAINSKNNQKDAMKVINEHPNMILRLDDFASYRINWKDKVTNMNEIAIELNIGLDSIVFFDDDPVNRDMMRKILPEVLTPDLPKDPSFYVKTLTSLIDFNVQKITHEDSERNTMYLQQRKRKDLFESTTLNDFLQQLNIKVHIKKADKFAIPRISQLTLKTNQFNLTTRRYQEEDIQKFIDDNQILVGYAEVEDKFGNNGITGVFIVKCNSTKWIIDTFLLSCRIMGREVEHMIMSYILKEAKKNNVKEVLAEYLPTEKNIVCKTFLQDYGFKKKGNKWVYTTYEKIYEPKHIKLE